MAARLLIQERLIMLRRCLLLFALLTVTSLPAGGCRSCSDCHDYDPPVMGCDCCGCGHRAGSACACDDCGTCGCGSCGCGETHGGYEGEFAPYEGEPVPAEMQEQPAEGAADEVGA
jgi:hypothetical protein